MARFLLSVLVAYLLAAAATLPGALAARAHLRHMRRHLRQVDSSIRQETVAFRMVSALRKTGGDAAEAANSYGGDLGSQNFEKKASWRSYNNMLSTLGRYAKPTDNGARGEVAARRGAKRDYNDSGDLEDSNYYLEQAGQKNLRLMLVQDEMERRKQKNGAGR